MVGKLRLIKSSLQAYRLLLASNMMSGFIFEYREIDVFKGKGVLGSGRKNSIGARNQRNLVVYNNVSLLKISNKFLFISIQPKVLDLLPI